MSPDLILLAVLRIFFDSLQRRAGADARCLYPARRFCVHFNRYAFWLLFPMNDRYLTFTGGGRIMQGESGAAANAAAMQTTGGDAHAL